MHDHGFSTDIYIYVYNPDLAFCLWLQRETKRNNRVRSAEGVEESQHGLKKAAK